MNQEDEHTTPWEDPQKYSKQHDNIYFFSAKGAALGVEVLAIYASLYWKLKPKSTGRDEAKENCRLLTIQSWPVVYVRSPTEEEVLL